MIDEVQNIEESNSVIKDQTYATGKRKNSIARVWISNGTGNITINMQSTPLVDIDFICWGPFTDPSTMCDSLTAPYVEDCSYSTAAIEICDITNAISGQYYILLIIYICLVI